MVPTGIKYTESLMLIYMCLYMHVSQYSLVFILHMFCVYCVISTLQELIAFFLVGKLRLHLVFLFLSLLSTNLVGCKTQNQDTGEWIDRNIVCLAHVSNWIYADQIFHTALYYSQLISLWIKILINMQQMTDRCVLIVMTRGAVS